MTTMDDSSSLELNDTYLSDPPSGTHSPTDNKLPPPAKSGWLRKYRVVLGVVVLVLLLAIGITVSLQIKKPSQKLTLRPIVINTQSLDNGTLNKLSVTSHNTTEQSVQLTITPNTLFKSDVHVQGGIQVDKNLEVGGTSTLQGAVSINNNLAIRGSVSVGGSLSAASLNIGSLTTTAITASGSISFGEHLVPTGAVPAVTAGRAAIGGSVQISGNDTAGTVTISTGSGSALAGELATITFHKAFATTPKVQLTAINAESANLRFYAARSVGFFTIDTATPPAQGASYTFDYLVTQ